MHHLLPFGTLCLLLLPDPSLRAQADAGADQWVCGDSTWLQAVGVGPGFTGTWSVYTGSGTFAFPSYHGSLVTGLTVGDNDLVWTVTDGTNTTTDTVTVVAYDPAVTPVYTMGDTAIIGPPFNITLFASPYAYPQFCNWTIVSGTAYIYQPNAYTTYATDLSPGMVVFEWTCDNGPCGVNVTQLAVSVNWMSTGVLESSMAPPFHFDPATGSLVIVSGEAVRGLRIRDMDGRDVMANDLPDGIYVASAMIGGVPHTQRFVVSR